MVKKILSHVGEFKKDSLLTPLCVSGETVLEVLIPLMMAAIIDNGLNTGNMKYVFGVGLVMLAMAMASLACGVLAGRYASRASTGLARNLRKAMYDNIQEFSFANIDKFSTAGLITRLTTDVTNIQNAYQMIIRMCVRSPLMMIFSMIMCVYLSPKLSVIFLVALVFLSIVLYFVMTRAHGYFKKLFHQYDELNARVQENVTAIRTVKAYVREDFENKKFKEQSHMVYYLSVCAEKLVVMNMPVMQFTVYTCILLLSWLGARMIVAGDMTTGALMSLFTYSTQILSSLMMISMAFVMLTMAKSSGDRVVEVLDEKSSLTNGEAPVMSVADGSIEFDNVSFRYNEGENKEVLRNVTFSIRSGQTIGVLGGTGSSKSTLVQLIPRLYDATEGSVKVGGRDVREYDLETLRNEVAMVLQKNELFSGTIKENLRWGKKDATDEEIELACRHAQAHEFIEKMPDGYDTYIEQGGTNVSGGQKQRLCIARALIKKPKVLILDDSTSAVDTRTDALIRQAFAQDIPDTTKLIIAQRISSVQEADQIIVLNHGRVNGIGTHEELLQKNEIYRDVYQSQQKGGAEESAESVKDRVEESGTPLKDSGEEPVQNQGARENLSDLNLGGEA
ncbi:MAG: ABC transporter ATP-binding protein [Lachnospiraceae bacterium]|nr:ABC transporter ATP-binding protein [Lachnospiraceae bacterium]